jgi:hypothetical protein
MVDSRACQISSRCNSTRLARVAGLRRRVAAERQRAKKEDVIMKNDYETVIFHVE